MRESKKLAKSLFPTRGFSIQSIKQEDRLKERRRHDKMVRNFGKILTRKLIRPPFAGDARMAHVMKRMRGLQLRLKPQDFQISRCWSHKETSQLFVPGQR